MRTVAVLVAGALVAVCLAVSAPALTPTKVVKIGDFFFSPKRLTVRMGDEGRVALGGISPAQRRRARRAGEVSLADPGPGSFSHGFIKKGINTCIAFSIRSR